MAGSFPGIVLRKGTLYARIVVPKDVRHLFESGELWQTLKTSNFAEARKAAPPIIADFKGRIAAARRGAVSEDRTQPARIALAKWAVTEGRRLDEGAEPVAHTPWEIQAQTELLRRAWEHTDGWKHIRDFDATLVRALAVGGLRLSPDDAVIPLFRQEAALTFMYATLARERDRLSEALRIRAEAVRSADLDDIAAWPESPESVRPPPSLTIRQLFDRWIASVKPVEKERGRLDHQIKRLIEFLGDKPANYLTRSEVEEFMGLVARFPGRKRPAALNAMPIRELVEKFEAENAERDEPWNTLTKTTAHEWFASFNRMYAYAVKLDLIDKNPWSGLHSTIKGRDSIKRRAYTDAEIKTIFEAPLFKGTRDAKFWLPILSLFHGTRLTELAAMPLADVKVTAGGVHFFDLTKRSVKTATSKRLIPLHPHMIEVGFLDHVEGLRAKGETWLFPELDHVSPLGAGHAVSRWWGIWCDHNGLSDPTITLHSWRHSWKRRARASDVAEEIHDIISGHAPASVARGYGAGADIEDLAREMAKITFPAFPALPVARTSGKSV